MGQLNEARDVGAVLAEFAQFMAGERSAQLILERLGAYCTELLPVAGVGVLLKNPKGGLEAVTANTEAGVIVEKAEVELREGPCTDSLETGEQVAAPDLEQCHERWPRFVPIALESGVRAIHGLPLTARSETLGSLNIIATDVLNMSASDIATAQMLADVTVAYIVNTRVFEEKSTLAEQLQRALDSRIIIEQAKGVLSERHGLTVTDAFERMRKYARSKGRKLHDVAAEVVRGGVDP